MFPSGGFWAIKFLKFQFRVMSPSYVTGAAVRMMPYQNTYDNGVYYETSREQQQHLLQLQRNGMVQTQAYSGGPQIRRSMVTVRSATGLSGPSIGNSLQTEQLETCQGAMAKQVSVFRL